jgi:hypothetical protein
MILAIDGTEANALGKANPYAGMLGFLAKIQH